MLQGIAAPPPVSLGNYAAGNYAGVPTPTDRPMGHIPQEMQENERLCLTLHDEIGSLEARINQVLRPSAPDVVGANQNTPAPVKSECASAITELNRQLHRAILRVRDLAARADL